MSETAVSKLWGFFSLSLLTLSFLFFLRTTHAEPKGDIFGILAYLPTTIPVLALPVDLVLMGITLWLSWVWTTKFGGPSWAHRVPVFHFERKDVDPATLGGRVYQGFAVFLSLVVPMLLLVQMTDRFFSAKVYGQAGDTMVPVVKDWRGHFDMTTLLVERKGLLRFGAPDGPEYLVWEPWVFSILVAFIAAFWVVVLWTIFHTDPSKRQPLQDDLFRGG